MFENAGENLRMMGEAFFVIGRAMLMGVYLGFEIISACMFLGEYLKQYGDDSWRPTLKWLAIVLVLWTGHFIWLLTL